MSLRRWVSGAAAAALLFAGLTNAHAHVHLCLDGSEAPATLHWATGDALSQAHGDQHDFPHEHHGATDAARVDVGHDDLDLAHDDVDLEVSASAIAKTVKHDALPATPCGPLLALAPPRAAHVAAASEIAPSALPARTRPQPRAPPSLS